jgi:HAD superfamily hydrolase (TIGR01509 family)
LRRLPDPAAYRGRLKALIFDMDGTLTNSDPVHLRAFAEALAPFGRTMTEEEFRRSISGRTNAEIGRALFPDRTPAEQDRFSDDKEALFRTLATDLTPLAGLIDLLDRAGRQGLTLACVTNAPGENARHMLDALDLAARFPVVVIGEDAERPKPDPQPYQIALRRLGLAPDEAIAFEDSVPGVRSASGAALLTFGVATSQAPETLVEAGATAVIADYADPILLRWLDGVVHS